MRELAALLIIAMLILSAAGLIWDARRKQRLRNSFKRSYFHINAPLPESKTERL